MTKFLCLFLLALSLRAEENQSNTIEQPIDLENEHNTKSKDKNVERKLQDNLPYVTNHIVHHQPYYASGYAPYHIYSPMMLPPPSPMLAMPPMVPPPPPIFTSGQLPIQNAYHIIHHPQHMASPWNVNAFPHVFNPYMGHRWTSSSVHPSLYSSMPYGLHPFSNPGVGYPYGMSPYYNPYMSMMAMGSMYPFLGASAYSMSHIAGGYGMYGPNNPLNIGQTINTLGGIEPGEDRPMNDMPMMNRKLSIKSTSALKSKDSRKNRLLKGIEDSKQNLIRTLQESLKQLQTS